MKHNDKMSVPGKPDIAELVREYNRGESHNETRTRTRAADDLRYNVWAGQSESGKKEKSYIGESPFPWEGASDSRMRFVDGLCGYRVNLMLSAFQNSSIQPAGSLANSEEANGASAYMKWLIYSWLYPELAKEIELHANYVCQYGWSVMHVSWDRCYTLQPRTITMDDLAQLLSEQAKDYYPDIDTPEAYIKEQTEFIATMLSAQSGISVSEAKSKINELLETGRTDFPIRVKSKDDPYFTALRPYYECIIPPETSDLQDARVIFRREYISEAEVKSRAAYENWDPKFTEYIIEHGQKTRPFQFEDWHPGFGEYGASIDSDENLLEIVYAYRRVVQEDGTNGIYLTVIHPERYTDDRGEELYGVDKLVNNVGDKYPFLEFTNENIRRTVCDSRGIPHIAKTWEYELKAQFDSLVDRTSYDTLPPIKVPLRYGDRPDLSPAAMIPEMRPNDITFMDPPRREPSLAFLVMDALHERADRYFGRPNSKIDPSETIMMQQTFINRWLGHLSSVFQMAWDQVEAFGDDVRYNKIVGVDSGIPRDPLNSRFWLHFDVSRLNSELMIKKLEAISNFILPEDMAGSVNRNEIVRYKLEAIDPQLAKTAIIDDSQASQKIMDDVKNQAAQMSLGNKPTFIEKDPAASAKLKFLQQIIMDNPKYQAQMQNQNDPFGQLVDSYVQNLNMSVSQEQNKVIGRLGVNPNVAIQ